MVEILLCSWTKGILLDNYLPVIVIGKSEIISKAVVWLRRSNCFYVYFSSQNTHFVFTSVFTQIQNYHSIVAGKKGIFKRKSIMNSDTWVAHRKLLSAELLTESGRNSKSGLSLVIPLTFQRLTMFWELHRRNYFLS